MEQHSAELNALTKDEIDKFKRTSMHNKVTMNWLKSHHVDKAKLQYLFFPEELYKHCEINDLFRGFDQDQSEGIEVSELINMFKDNNIKLNRAEIDAIFHLVDANGDNTLNLSEFKKSVFSDTINQAFAKLMRSFRARQGIKKNGLESLRSLPKVENSNRDGAMSEQEVDGLKSNPGSIKDLGSKNELGVIANEQGKFTSKKSIQSFENPDEKDEKYRVIPSTFASMVEYFSYNFQRKEQIKKCSMIPSTQALPKAVQLENLMQLSSKYTDQTLAKIYKLHDRYRYRSFDNFSEEEGGDKNRQGQSQNISCFNAQIPQLQEENEVEQEEESKSQQSNTNSNANLKQTNELAESKYSMSVIDNQKYETAKQQPKIHSFYFPNKQHSVQPFSAHGQNRTISTANVSYQSPSNSFSMASSKRQISKRPFPVIISDHAQYPTPHISQCSTPLTSQATLISPSNSVITSPLREKESIQTKKAYKLAKLLQSEIPPSQNFSLKKPPYLNQFKTGRHSLHTNPPDVLTQGDTNIQRQAHFFKTFFKKPLISHNKNQLSGDTTFVSSSKTATTSPTTAKIHRFSQGNINTAQVGLLETPSINLLSSAAGSVRKRSLRIEEQYLKNNIKKIEYSQRIKRENEEIKAPSTLLDLVRRQHGDNYQTNEPEFTDKRSIQKQQLFLQKQQQMSKLQQGQQNEEVTAQEIIPVKSKAQLEETGEEFQKFSFTKRTNSQPTIVQFPPKPKNSIPKSAKTILNISNLTTDSCFQDTMFMGKQSEIQNNYQEEIIPQGDQKEEKQQLASRGNRDLSNCSRDTSSTRIGLKSQNYFPSQNSFKRIDSLTRGSNFLSVTPSTTTEHLIQTLTTFNNNNKNNLPQTSKGKRLTFQ